MAHFVIISGQKYFNARQVAFPPATAWGDLESSIKGDSYEVSMSCILSFWFTISECTSQSVDISIKSNPFTKYTIIEPCFKGGRILIKT